MKITDILLENLSSIVYHYTRLDAASKILNTGEFELSSTLGSVEEQYAPKGYHYFLSTTRTVLGGYHSTIGSDAVLFVLDGNWYNQRYPAGPVDYWLNRNPSVYFHRQHEAEDRLFAKSPTIPITGVSSIHVYLSDDPKERQYNEYMGARARQVIMSAKKRSIPVYVYHDKEAWRLLNKRKSVPISNNPTLKGPIPYSKRTPRKKSYIYPWIELITKTSSDQLSKDAKSLQYSLKYTYDNLDAAKGLANNLSNARKPSAGQDREDAVKIISYMRQNGLNNIGEFVESIAAKWKDKK